MKKTKLIIGLFVLLVNSTLLAQTVELSGVVTGEDNVENIHILNNKFCEFTSTTVFYTYIYCIQYNDYILNIF